jgi:hypothetical protein
MKTMLSNKAETTILIPDVHLQAPVLIDGEVKLPDSRHDPVALSPVLQVVKKYGADRAIIMGDMFDNQQCSGWTAKINRGGRIMTDDGQYHFSAWKETLKLGETFLRYIRKCLPKSEIVFLEGNHEFRSEFELRKNDLLASFGDAISIRLNPIWAELDIQYIPWNGGKTQPWVRIGDITVMHGFGTSDNQYMLQNHRIVHADSHNIDFKKFAKRNLEDKGGGKDTMWSWAIGCLCNLRPEFATKGGRANAWEHGFAYVSTYKGMSHVDVYRIVNGTVVNFRGEVVEYVPLATIDKSLSCLDYKPSSLN